MSWSGVCVCVCIRIPPTTIYSSRFAFPLLCGVFTQKLLGPNVDPDTTDLHSLHWLLADAALHWQSAGYIRSGILQCVFKKFFFSAYSLSSHLENVEIFCPYLTVSILSARAI